MIRRIPFESLYLAEHGWLRSRFHFSFAEYRNPDNVHFGVLRVMNDDVIAPGSGFDMHPHNDMEIVTYVISGELTHEDSMGHRETLGRGDVQYMSAGTGVLHSETNEGREPVHLIQTWIFPRARHLKPRYGSVRFSKTERENRWLRFAGPDGDDTPVQLHQDVNLYAAELSSGKTLTFETGEDRQLYVKVMEGDVIMNGIALGQGDAAEAAGETLRFVAAAYAHLLVVEMAKDRED